MFCKTLIATAVVGTGLASLAGIASAHESGHTAAKGCSNTAEAAAKNSSGDSLGDTTGSPQSLDASNVCDILNGNKVLSGNNVSSGLSSIVNGDTTDKIGRAHV